MGVFGKSTKRPKWQLVEGTLGLITAKGWHLGPNYNREVLELS